MKTEGKKFAICIDGWDPYWSDSGHYFVRIPFRFDDGRFYDLHPRQWEASGDMVVLSCHARYGMVEEIVKSCAEIVEDMRRGGELDVSNPLLGDMESKHYIRLDDIITDAFCVEAWLEWEDADIEGWPHSINNRKE